MKRWQIWLAIASTALMGAVLTLTGALTTGSAPRPAPATNPQTKAISKVAAKKAHLIINGRRQPRPVKVPHTGSGTYTTVSGTDEPPRGSGRTVRYLVEVEQDLPFAPHDFATQVHKILNDPRGWGHRFERVSRGPVDLRVSLSSPALANRKCLPLDVGSELSCWHNGRAVINATRWGQGATSYGRDLATYREYLITHEIGHGLGHQHATCPAPGRPAPAMVQQTKSLHGCRPNPWPSLRAGPRHR